MAALGTTLKVHPGKSVEGRRKAQDRANKTGRPVSLLQPFTRYSKSGRSKTVWTTYDTVYPSKSNPGRGTGTSSYTAISGGAGNTQKTFGYLKSAKKWAQEEANRTGITTIIYPNGKGSTHHVRPKKAAALTSNPGRLHRVKFSVNGKSVTGMGKYDPKIKKVRVFVSEGTARKLNPIVYPIVEVVDGKKAGEPPKEKIVGEYPYHKAIESMQRRKKMYPDRRYRLGQMRLKP